MAQQPVLSPATIAGERPQVVREVYGPGQTYNNLTGSERDAVDAQGNAAFYQVTEWAKWYTEVSPDIDDLPTMWNEAFSAVWVANLRRITRSPQAYHSQWSAFVQPLLNRIADHFTADWQSATTLATDEFTVGSIRKSALAVVIRQRTPIFPPIREVDRIIRDEFVSLWNERPWEFRKRLLELTITEAGTVEAAGAFIFDGLASKTIVIRTNEGSVECHWIDSTLAAQAAAKYASQTGVPLFFYDTDFGTTKKIKFFPAPDDDYSAYASVLIGAPAFGDATATTGLDNLPVEFRGLLRETVIARIVSRWGREDNDASRLYGELERKKRDLTANWDDKGASRHTARVHHSAAMINRLRSADGTNIIGGQA